MASERDAVEEATDVIDLGSGRFDTQRRRVLGLGVRAAVRPFLNGRTPLAVRRRVLSKQGHIAQPVPDEVTVDVVELGGRPAWRFTPEGVTPGRSVLYCHGGGYNYGDIGTHGGAVATLASSLAATIWMPDYRLRPESPATAPLEDLLAVWRDFVEGHDPGRTLLAGDSAGAHLALSLACELRDAGLPQPRCLALLSPWVDADPARVAYRPQDAILTRKLMAGDAEVWLGDGDHKDPLYSPIHRDFTGLPPTLVQWGQHEALHLDAERLVGKLLAADVDVTAEAYVGLWHDAFLQVPLLLEAPRWLARTAVWAAQRLRATGQTA